MAAIHVEHLHFYLDGFDNVLMVNMDIRNGNIQSIKDLEISCSHFGASGTKIGESSKTYFQIIKAEKTKKLRAFNMGLVDPQTETINCDITNFDFA